jgi:hypothetical protein
MSTETEDEMKRQDENRTQEKNRGPNYISHQNWTQLSLTPTLGTATFMKWYAILLILQLNSNWGSNRD